MEFIVDNSILVKEPTKELIAWVQSTLVLRNPEYLKKIKLGKWVGNTPEYLWLYSWRAGDIELPFGCLKDLWELYPDRSLWKPHYWLLEQREYHSRITLYPYQEKAAREAIKARNGIIVMPCGSGKTQTGLEVASRIGGKTLWITHTTDLLNQSKSRALSVLGIPKGLGTITGGKVNIGTHITFATVQTLSKINLEQFKYEWDTIICDECHHCCGTPTRVTQFYKVMSMLSARYKFGLTATPYRSDGLDKSMFALLGGICAEVSREEVANNTCPVKVRTLFTGWTPDYNAILMADGTINYAALVSDMIRDDQRLERISDTLNQLEGATLVLANRVEYLTKMKERYSKRAVCLSAIGNSKAAREERKEALRKLNEGSLDCIFATYQLAKEGLDVPNLRYVVFATPEKDETTVMQAAGRAGRKADGKTEGIVLDFVDDFGMYLGWAKKRARFYKKYGYAQID